MPDDVLLIRSDFDASGLQRGVDIGTASLREFEIAVKKVAELDPKLSAFDLATMVAPGIRKAAAEADALANKVQLATAATMTGGQRMADGFAQAATQAEVLSAEIRQVLSGSQKMAAGMTAAAHQVQFGFETLGRRAQDLNKHFEVGRVGGRRLESALTGIALQGAGVSGVMGRLIEGLVLFGAANVELVEIAAALSVVVVAYQLLTRSQQEAKKAHDDVVKSFQTRVEGVTSGNPATQRGQARQEIDRLQTRDRQLSAEIAGFQMDIVGNLVRRVILHFDIVKQQKLSRDLAEDEARVVANVVVARIQAAQQLIDIGQQVRKVADDTRKAALESRAAIAAQGPQTFGAQPGVLSNQEQQAFNDRIRLAKLVTAEDVKALEVQRAVASQTLAAQMKAKSLDEDAIVTANAKIEAFAFLIELRKAEGDQAVKNLQHERDLLVATRNRLLAETAHANRVIAAGGGNLLGANSQFALRLPDQSDIQKLIEQLKVIPPIGIPTPQEIRNAWDAAAKEAKVQALPSILQPPRKTVGDPASPWTDAVQEIRKATAEAKKFEQQTKEARDQGQRLRDSFTDVANTASAIASVGQSLGFLSAEAADAINNVGALADALAKVAEHATTGNILGAISAGATVLGSLFGESALAKEHKALIAQNNQRLDELKIELNKTNLGGAGFDKVARVLGVSNIFKVATQAKGGAFTDRPSQELVNALNEAGLSLRQFAILVEQQTGLKVLDKEGHLVADAWAQARIGLNASIAQQAREDLARAQDEASRRLGELAAAARAASDAWHAAQDAFSQQLHNAIPGLLDIRRQLTGKSGDLNQQFQDALIGLAPITASSGLLEMFQGFNLNDPGARDELRKRILDMVNNLINGGAAQLQDPAQFQPLIDFLTQGANILDQFNSSVADATKSMTNVPRGLNTMALEFEASLRRASDVHQALAVGTAAAAAAPNAGVSGAGSNPVAAAVQETSASVGEVAAAVLALADSQAQINTTLGDLAAAIATLDNDTLAKIAAALQGGDQSNTSSAAKAAQVRKALERVSHARFGTPDKWGT